MIDYDPSSPTYQQVTDIYVVSGGENYPVVETDNETYTVDHVVVVNPGENYKNEDVITDEQGNVYDKILDEVTVIGDVKFFDKTENIYIESEKAIYSKKFNIVKTYGLFVTIGVLLGTNRSTPR